MLHCHVSTVAQNGQKALERTRFGIRVVGGSGRVITMATTYLFYKYCHAGAI